MPDPCCAVAVLTKGRKGSFASGVFTESLLVQMKKVSRYERNGLPRLNVKTGRKDPLITWEFAVTISLLGNDLMTSTCPDYMPLIIKFSGNTVKLFDNFLVVGRMCCILISMFINLYPIKKQGLWIFEIFLHWKDHAFEYLSFIAQ